jgi:rubrerythrin
MVLPASETSLAARWTRALAWLGGQWAFRSHARAARLLYGFARTEAQSQLELRQAAQACGDARRRARYLRHALDEARHAHAFAEHAAELARLAQAPGFARPHAASERLYERWGEPRFLAFVHLGERRGRVEFETYARLLRKRGAEPLARLFEALEQDERQHEAYTARLLEELAGAGHARRTLAWAARRTAWRALRRRGRALAMATYGVAMLLVYAALAPFALATRACGKAPRGFSREL